MKDLYSFHASEEDLFSYYEKVKEAYFKVFKRCGLYAYCTMASGGAFTMSNTHEFQVLSEVGEDEILYCEICMTAENMEVSSQKEGDKCRDCGGEVKKASSIEVGNIFPLGTKYSKAFNLYFTDKKGEKSPVVMGSYGIGISRLMGAIVEIHNDDKGILWPDEISPFDIYLAYLPSQNKNVKGESEKIYKNLQASGMDVLYDDRDEASVGEKFADADLLGMTKRVVVSEKSLAVAGVEVKKRSENEGNIMSAEELIVSTKQLGK